MQPTINIDWSGVRTLAITVGVREAARRLGISEEATMKRCQREGWLAEPESRACAARSVQERSVSALSAAVRTPAEVMKEELAGLNADSRLSVARGLRKASEHIEQMAGQKVLEDAGNVKQTVQSLAVVHGWAANQPTARLAIRITGNADAAQLPEQQPAIDAEWSEG